jgi:hypothetical protein
MKSSGSERFAGTTRTHATMPSTSFLPRPQFLLAVAATATLAACTCDNDGNGSHRFDPASLQGRWATATGATPGYTAIALPDSANANGATAWVLAHDASRLFKLAIDNNRGLSGRSFSLADGTASNVTGGVDANLQTAPNAASFSGLFAAPLALNRSDDLTGTAPLGDAAGTWKATPTAMEVNWTAASNGTLSGTSTTGCSFAGALNAPATVKLYTVAFTETCAGVATSFSGIATVSADLTRLTVTATTTGDSQAVALFFLRQ